MLRLHSKKIAAFVFFCVVIFFCMIISSCAPLIPSNYLRPSSMQIPQKINNKWVKPRLIPVSAEMLNTPEGRVLLEPAMRPQLYRAGAYDNLNVIVWGHPEFSTVATNSIAPISSTSLPTGVPNMSNLPIVVQSDGMIFFPYVGSIKVAGLTINQIQNKIAKRLSNYLRNPQVTVQVSNFRNRNIYVFFEIN